MPAVFASAAELLPGAAASAVSTFSRVCPRGAGRRRACAALAAAGFAVDGAAPPFLAAARPARGVLGRPPTRARRPGTEHAPVRASAAAALQPLEFARHRTQLTDAGLHLSANSVDQVGHQRRLRIDAADRIRLADRNLRQPHVDRTVGDLEGRKRAAGFRV
jgi:hypothetical protein